jgi:23S rRNA-/tRNA-specific pseudouridylate synthase
MNPEDLEERILLERDGLLAIDKPPGLPTSGLSLDDPDCLQHALIERHGDMVWAVHQIDADTSGVNLFVTEKRLVKEFKRQMESPTARKRYLAVVHGAPNWEQKTVRAPIGIVNERSLGVHPEGKSAHSEFVLRSRGVDAAVVEARIFTGRTHQIRIHLAHLGHPLMGEEWYRTPPCTEHPRQALHGWKMELETLEIVAPIPEDLLELMRGEGLSLES